MSKKLEGEDTEDVKKLKNLGAMINADGMCNEEIEQQVGAAANAVGAMRKEVLERRELQKRSKMRVFNTMVVPTLIYGCETWTMQRRHESKIQAFEMINCKSHFFSNIRSNNSTCDAECFALRSL